MTTEIISIVDPDQGAGWDYDSLNAWESGEQANIVAADEQHTAKCRSSSGTTDSTVTVISGWTTDATRYIKVWTDPAENYRHSAKWTAGAYTLQNAANPLFAFVPYVYIIGLQIDVSGDADGISFQNLAAAGNIYVEKNIIRNNAGSPTNEAGIFCMNATAAISVYIQDNIIYGWSGHAGDRGIWVADADYTAICYNNTIVNCYNGIDLGNFGGTLKNNLIYDAGSTSNEYVNLSGATVDYNAGEHATGVGTHWTQISSDPFVGSASSPPDYHITSGSAPQDAGVGPGEDGNVSTSDIDGDSRSGATCDIGVDEYAAGGGTAVDATSEALILTEYPANVSLALNIGATSESLTLTEYPTTVSLAIDVQATSASLTLTEYGADVIVGTNVNAGSDALTLTEYPATVSLDIDIQATSESLILTEYNATVDVSVATNVEATSEQLTLTEYPATVSLAIDVQAGSESLVLTQYNATVDTSVSINVEATSAALILTQYPATVSLDIDVQAGTDSLVLTQYAANVSLDLDVKATSESLILAEYGVVVTAATNITATAEALVLTEYAATVEVQEWINILFQGIDITTGKYLQLQGRYKLR